MFKKLNGTIPVAKTIGFFAILIVVTTITYSNHFENAFHFDDSHTIENNLFIQDIKNIPLFFKDGTTFSSLPSNQSYRPIVSASLAIDYWLGSGYNLFYFHLSTYLLFLVQAVLLFFLLIKLLSVFYNNVWNFYIAASATAWYTLHPANAETINYVIARSDVQSTFFVVLAFVLYLYSNFCKKYFLYLIPIGIGVLAKPPAVMFAPMLFCYILLFEENISLTELFQKKSFKPLLNTIKKTIPAFVFCVAIYFLVDKLTPKTWISGGYSTVNYLITQPFVILHYFNTFFLPFGLSADTDWQPLQSIFDIRFFVGVLFIALLIFIAIWFSKDARLRPISFGIIWFFLALIPSSSVIPFAEVMNDHRIFFPYVGLAISVCYTIALLLMKYKKRFYSLKIKYEYLILTGVVLLLSGYAYGTHQRNKVWNTEESLWQDVTIKSPKNGRGLMNYGLSKMRKGDYASAENYFFKALPLLPYYSFLHVNIGVLKNATGDKTTAETYFKNAVQYGNGYPDTWFFYGKFLFEQARYNEAIPNLEKAIELAPAHLSARSLLMNAYNQMQAWDKLKILAQNTLQIIPDNPEALAFLKMGEEKNNAVLINESDITNNPSAEKYLTLSLQYYNSKDYGKCIDAAKQALKLKPNYAEAYNNIGSAYNMLQQYDNAIEALQKALAINPNYDLAKNNLLLALNSKNNIPEKTIIDKSTNTADDYLNLSLTYYNQGEYEKCIDACKSALKLKADYADAYSNMCAAYNQLKQYDKAIEACNNALKINPQHKLANGNLNWAKQEKSKSK